MRVYSPSQTIAYMKCPAFRQVYRAGWRSKWLSKGDVAAILGRGIHHGLAQYYRTGRQLNELIITGAQTVVATGLSTLQEQGCLLGTGLEDLVAGLGDLTQLSLERYAAADPIPPTWTWLEPELILPDYGPCIIDLPVNPGLLLEGGVPLRHPLDFKVKLNTPEKYRDKTKLEFAYSWQMFHYVWALGQALGTPATQFYVVYLWLAPKFKAELCHYPIDPELLQLWFNSAETVWALMAAQDGHFEDLQAVLDKRGRLYPWTSFEWFNRFGREPYADAILYYKGDSNLMAQDYVKVQKDWEEILARD